MDAFTAVARLSAFMLQCVGIQILVLGLHDATSMNVPS
jgi:hypothetical protein